MAKKIKAIVKYPGKEPEIRTLTDELETYQKIVNGYIECVQLERGVTLICNDEGLLNDMPFNAWVGGHYICGPIVIVGCLGDHFASIMSDRAIYWYDELLWQDHMDEGHRG